MLYSIKGKVTFISKRFVVVETGGIGYEILVSKPENYVLGEDVFLYLHHHLKEDNEYLAGFKDKDEQSAFNLLLNVNGIGPKSALTILSNCTYEELLFAISNQDVDFIRSIPGINERAANQILLDLKGFIAKSNKENSKQYQEAKEALKALKWKVKDIDRVLSQIYIPNGSTQDIILEASRRLHYGENYGQK